MNGLMHQQSRSCDARLTRGCEDAGHDALDGLVDIRVREDELRRFTPEFEGEALEVLSRVPGNVPAAVLATREGDLVHSAVGGQRFSDIGAEAGDHVEDASRKSCLLDEPHEFERGRRCELGRFEDDRAAGREGGRQFPGRQQ